MTSLFFLILSNFITCSYARNFTVFELLKKPLVFRGGRQNTVLVFSVPKAIPVEETILVIDNSFRSKWKDLALKKGIKEQDKDNNFIILDADSLQNLIHFDEAIQFESFSLVYSPWYRFVSEPFHIGEVNILNEHVLGIFSYALRGKNIESKVEKEGEMESSLLLNTEYSGFNKISLKASTIIESVQLEGPEGCSRLDIKEKKVLLNKRHNPLLFSALDKVEEGTLKNIKIDKTKTTIELAYEE